MSNIFSTVTTYTVFSQSLHSEAVRLNTEIKNLTFSRKLCPKHTECHSPWPVEKRKGNQGRVKRCLGWTPASDVRAPHFSPHSVEGIHHKSVHFPRVLVKKKGLSDWKVGTLPIQNSLGSWGCAASPLLSPLCCQSAYPYDFGQGKKHSQTEHIWKFSGYVL